MSPLTYPNFNFTRLEFTELFIFKWSLFYSFESRDSWITLNSVVEIEFNLMSGGHSWVCAMVSGFHFPFISCQILFESLLSCDGFLPCGLNVSVYSDEVWLSNFIVFISLFKLAHLLTTMPFRWGLMWLRVAQRAPNFIESVSVEERESMRLEAGRWVMAQLMLRPPKCIE